MKKIFKFNSLSKYGTSEYNKNDLCEILGFTYQDVGPIAWCLNLENNRVVGCNPVVLEFVREA